MSNSQTDWWAPVGGSDETADPFGGLPAQQDGPSRRSRSAGRQRAQRDRKRRRRRSVWVLVVALLLVAGAGYVVVSLVGNPFSGSHQAHAVSDYSGPGHGQVQVVVKPGDSGAAMARTLVDKGVVATPSAFSRAFAVNPDAGSIQPGTYNLMLQMKGSDAVAALLNPANRASTRVTLAEGLNAKQMFAKISATTGISVEDLQKAAADPASIGLPAEANGNVEGWLFPATYDVEPHASAADVLKQLTAKTVQVLQQEGVAQGDWASVLNKASLVEREAKLDEDRPKIARAIDNRLTSSLPLDIDSTTSYGLGITGAPTIAQNHDASNAYSTYVRIGLPPTPIANPGQKSIDAVVHPADGPWLFWCTVNLQTGETVMSTTQAEQDAAIGQLRAWQAANPNWKG